MLPWVWSDFSVTCNIVTTDFWLSVECEHRTVDLNYVKTLCKDSRQHNVMFYDFYSVFCFYLRLKISILKCLTNLHVFLQFIQIEYYAWVSCGVIYLSSMLLYN